MHGQQNIKNIQLCLTVDYGFILLLHHNGVNYLKLFDANLVHVNQLFIHSIVFLTTGP